MQLKGTAMNIKKYFTVVVLVILFNMQFISCFVTTSCHTAKTLKKGEKRFTPGFNHFLFYDNEKKFQLNTTTLLLPSFGSVWGITDNFEAGIRWYFTYTLEGSFRYQITPQLFEPFDMSINMNFGSYKFTQYPYTKLGLTIGNTVNGYQPFVSYHYSLMSGENGDIDEDLFTSNLITMGIGIPFRDDLIIPEINYYIDNNFEFKSMTLSIGIRAEWGRRR